ncbi:NAD-dependent epimerase/dehydratase family protein [Shimia abyssi]|uniref:Dihydroflavonol-4-reductase n=1 Tax=Shimia abyssi TaxID=1662395 RepID=A0A2P8FHH0_9RHOB|nr:NAD-dependent epimerase/dehydratase family protein [Shimia abyssi]PSL21181.1 dihydroflavonol-4-reductase [Shimia abyssi]
MADKPIEVATYQPVLVTGATGYVAGWIVRRLLEAGATVHAPVRDPENAAKVGHLAAIAEASPGEIKFFKADLLKEGSYAEAMEGCGVVFHTASPFTISVKDPQKELIDPAVKGTRNVLEEANRVESVHRVVLTSSCAAIYTDAQDTLDVPGRCITEDMWNTTASLEYQPYSYSKTLAEKVAWEIAEAQERWRLVVVNPSLVVGPAVQAKPTSQSFNILRQLGDGTARMGAPKLGFGVVDVRDLAEAHLAAGYLADAEGRHIVSGHETDLLEMALALRPKFADQYPLPKKALPKWLVWLVGPLLGMDRKFVSRTVNVPWRGDNSKSIRALGMSYRPMQESMEDMFTKMIEDGYIKK